MHAHIAGSLGNQQVIVDPVAMQVIGKKGPPVFFGPVVSQVNHGAAVGMAAACHRVMVGRVARIGPGTATPVQVVGDRLDPLVTVRVFPFSSPSLADHTRDDVPKVGQYRVGGDQVPVLVKICSPGIDHATGQFFKLMIDRMKPPHPARDPGPCGFRRPRLTDLGEFVEANGTIEPAIGTPVKIIEDVVGGNFKSVEHHDRLRVGNIVPVPVGNKGELGRVGNPNSAVPDRDAGQITSLVPKDGSSIKLSVVVCIFEYQDAIGGIILVPLGVGIVFYDPEAPAIVKIKGDGTTQIRFPGKERHVKTVRDRDPLERLLWRKRDIGRILAVGDPCRQIVRPG